MLRDAVTSARCLELGFSQTDGAAETRNTSELLYSTVQVTL